MVRVIASESSATRGLGRLAVRSTGHVHSRGNRATYVGLEFVAEPTHSGRDRRDGRRPERTDCRLAGWPVDSRTDVVADVEEQIDVLRATFTVDDAGEDLLEP